MSLISRAIPGLFGGVSQAIPAMRHPTQGELQENALSTVVAGLFKRPGSKHVAELPLSWASGVAAGNAHCHVVERPAGRWQLMFNGTTVKAVNMDTGVEETVAFQDALGSPVATPAYLTATDPATAFRTITVADTVFVVNAEKTVAAANNDATLTRTELYINLRTAVPSHTYSISVGGWTASYTAPATGVTVETVQTGLAAAIAAAGGAYFSTGITGFFAVWTSPSNPVVTNFGLTDTFGNTTMVGLKNGVSKYSDLPVRAIADPRLRIRIGGAEGTPAGEDAYYVEYKDGQGWTETRAFGINTTISSGTMPHKMFRSGGSWVVRPIVWTDRLVGDDITNPMPSFVGRQIRDIFFYRNRLGFLAGDSLCMSRSGDYYNFFAKTAIEVLDSDPLDLSGSAETVERLDWAVPFNEKLIVWATSKQQFALEGGDTLTPNSARLVPTTAFETVSSARPRPLGNRVVFPATINGFTQLSLYRMSADTVSRTAEPITDQAPSYIPVTPRAIEVSETAKVMCVVPSGLSSEMYVFKYEDDGDKLTQRAWQKFTLPGGIVKAHWAGQLLYLTLLYPNATSTGASVLGLEVLDFADNAVDTGLPYGIRLDRRVVASSAVASGVFGQVDITVAMPDSADLVAFRYPAGAEPVQLEVVSKTVMATSPTTLKLRVKAPATTGTFVVGHRYTMKYTFTEVFMRDGEGIPIMDARLKLVKMILRYVKTGFFKVKVATKAQGAYEYPFAGQGVGLPGQLLGTPAALGSGDFAIPLHAQAEGTTISIESDSHLPCCFPYAEWRGSLNMKSQR